MKVMCEVFVAAQDGLKVWGKAHRAGEVIEGAERLSTLQALERTGKIRRSTMLVDQETHHDSRQTAREEALGTERASHDDDLPKSARRRAAKGKSPASKR